MSAKLDPRIEAIRTKYELAADDFWELPQKKGTWLAKHAALETVAAQAGVVFDAPMIIEANSGEKMVAICVTGRLGERSEWSFGEASPGNNKNAYPYSMAEKRAKDRVILKLVGLHGLVYSEDEIDDEPAAPRKSSAQSKRDGDWDKITSGIDGCSTLDALKAWWKDNQSFIASHNKDWQEQAAEYKDKRKAALTTAMANGGKSLAFTLCMSTMELCKSPDELDDWWKKNTAAIGQLSKSELATLEHERDATLVAFEQTELLGA